MTVSEDYILDEKSLIDITLCYIAILYKYKVLIIGSTIAASILIVSFSIISLKLPTELSPLPNQYRAYAIVLFQEGSGSVGMSSMLSAFGIESNGSGISPTQLAIEILRSREFVDSIISEFDIIQRYQIYKSPITNSREVIIDNSQYSLNRDSGSLTISFIDTDPIFAAELVNFEVGLLQNWFLKQDISLRSKELSLMEEKLEDLTNEIKKTESDIESFQKKHGVLDIMELAAVQIALLTDLRTSLSQVELEISDYSEISTIEDPALTTLKSRRQNIINQIQKIENGYIGSDGRYMPSIEELPQLSLSFTHMMADLDVKNQLYKTLSERYEITKLSAAEESIFSVLEYAEIPEEKIGPSRKSSI